VSDPPKKKHPWENFYAQRGVARPRAVDTGRPADAKAPAKGSTPSVPQSIIRPTAVKSGDTSSLSPELAAAVAAALAGVGGNTNPLFVPLSQKAAIGRSNRRRVQRRVALIGLGAIAALVVLHLVMTRFLYRAPTAEALEEYGQKLEAVVLPLYSSVTQPLQFDRTSIELKETIDSSHLSYVASITLRLREPLYAPALTNGTAAYRQMQESVQLARALDLRLKLLANVETPEPPDLPLIIQVSHPARDPIVVRVPFDARRFGWRWRIEPPQLAQRSVNRAFRGDTQARFANTPHLIFGRAGAANEMRARLREGRDYVVAISKEAQKRPEVMAAINAQGGKAGAGGPAFDPNAPAVELPLNEPNADAANRPAFDPNAPAVEQPAAATDASAANRPAFDPNAPAVQFPSRKQETPPAIDPNAPAIQFPVRKPAPTMSRGK
jgi:hypothetical protein